MRFLNKLYPWLLPITVTVVLVLSLVAGERLKSNTPVGKFSRIHLGMDRQRVYEILGPTRHTVGGGYYIAWYFDDCMVLIRFDDQNHVEQRRLEQSRW